MLSTQSDNCIHLSIVLTYLYLLLNWKSPKLAYEVKGKKNQTNLRPMRTCFTPLARITRVGLPKKSMFSKRSKFLEGIWYRLSNGTLMQNLVEIKQAILEKKIFKCFIVNTLYKKRKVNANKTHVFQGMKKSEKGTSMQKWVKYYSVVS